ncbi:MAG: DUF190 domain-containing protein [Actinomycetota bacterium]|nr:DUF190 domain-containing protein [Actinomycetota bacterium]
METVEATKLTIYVGDMTCHRRRSSYRQVVRLLLDEGIAGAAVLRGIEGFGSGGRVHTGFIEALSMNLPVAVDSKEKAEAVLPKVMGILEGKGFVTLEKVEVVSSATAVASVL